MAAPHIVSTRKTNTANRHQLIRSRVNETYSRTVDGVRLDYDSVLAKVAADFGISPRTVRNILKATAD